MQQRKKWYDVSQPIRDIVTVVVYLIFFIYLFDLIIKEQTIAVQITFIMMGAGIGGIALLYEFLNRRLKKAVLVLTLQCDPKKGLEIIKPLAKYDILKSFRSADLVFHLLAWRDLGEFDNITSLDSPEGLKLFSKSYDLLLIYRHSLFVAYGELGDQNKCREFYKAAFAMKDKKYKLGVLTKKIAAVFSWEEMTALYKLYGHSYKESKKMFQQISIHNMNNREKQHYYLLGARIAAACEGAQSAEAWVQKAVDINAASPMAALAESLMDSSTSPVTL